MANFLLGSLKSSLGSDLQQDTGFNPLPLTQAQSQPPDFLSSFLGKKNTPSPDYQSGYDMAKNFMLTPQTQMPQGFDFSSFIGGK